MDKRAYRGNLGIDAGDLPIHDGEALRDAIEIDYRRAQSVLRQVSASDGRVNPADRFCVVHAYPTGK
jgi:hypothetical protein